MRCFFIALIVMNKKMNATFFFLSALPNKIEGMKDLKKAFEEGRYDEIIEATSNSGDAKDLYFRLASFLALNKSDEAMAILEKNREKLFLSFPIETIKYDLSLRFLREEFEEAMEDYDLLANLPYQSQAVEEALRDAKRAICSAKRASRLSKDMSLQEMREAFLSNDDYAIISLLERLQKDDFPAFEKEVLSLLRNDKISQLTRTYALLYLVGIRFEKEISFLREGQEIKAVPSSLTPPFKGEKYQETIELISRKLDPSFARLAKRLYDQYILLSYPLPVETGKEMASALSRLSSRYLRSDEEPLFFGGEEGEVEALEKKIEATLEN